ncbi:hypothetical protein BsWGS_22791 [Bradybaena similaris]
MAVNPGVQMRLTERGLNYVNTLAENSIKTELQTLKIADQSGQSGHLSWELKNIQVQSVAGPNSQITFNPEVAGLTWSLYNFGINLRSDWHAKYKQGWVKISDGGSLTVSLGDVSLTVAVGFGQKEGRPSISSKSCNAHIGNIDISFHGGSAIILNLLKGIVEGRMKDILESRICEVANKMINEDAEESLSTMNVYITIDNRFLLDYGLMAAPIVSSSFLQTLNKGEVYWKADMQECPFSPSAIPEWGEFNSMLYLWLTEYTANTFAYQAHHHGYLKYNMTKDNLAPDKAVYLNTSCSSMCIGNIIKEISKAYPESWVELRFNSTAVPNANITSQNITASAVADVELFAHTPDGGTHYVLTFSLSLSMTAQASIEGEKLIASIIDHSFDVTLVRSDIGEINVRKAKIFFETFLTFVIIPQLNQLGKAGIDLPVSKDVQFLNTKLILQDGVLLVATDAQYKGSIYFLSEAH